MATLCRSLARSSRFRLTRLDLCGETAPGATGTLVSSGHINIDAAFNYLDPEEITRLNANGDLCIDDRGNPQLRWIDLTIVMCQVDPFVPNIVAGDPLVVDDAVSPNTVGFRVNCETTSTARFALEVWTNISGQPCSAAGLKEYGYFLFPFVGQARYGDFSVANAAINLTMTARTFPDSLWGTGPAAYTIRRDAVSETPEVLLTAIDDCDHMHYEVTTVPPPEAVCGGQVLV